MSAGGGAPEWDRLEALFEAACARSAEERSAFLDRKCSDPELRSELEELLARVDPAERLFDRMAASLDTFPARLGAAGPDAEPEPGDEAEPAQAATSEPASAEGSAASDPSDPLLGTVVGQYRIQGRLGGGGMGVVYRARDTRLEREVALKFLPPHLGYDPEAKERFLVEARAAAALDHPNICTVHEIGETEDGRLFLAMARYEGETLEKRIDRGPLPVQEAVAITAGIAQGLAAAHARGVVHRDVKPGNVMLTADGGVKLLDFGLAKVADVTLTPPGMMRGTVAYMSPEQLGGEAVDARMDLWSLGVVAYEMLAGRRPFRGEHEAVVLDAIRHVEPEPVGELRPETPECLSAAVGRLLAKDPAGRYPDAQALLADLEPDPTSGEPATTAGATDPARTLGAPQPRRWGLWTAAALLVVATAAILAYREQSALSSSAAAGHAGPSPTAGMKTIAVLPLENLSPDSSEAYFAGAMTDELTSALSVVPGFRIVSRTSASKFAGSRDVGARAIADSLGAGYLVEGSLRRVGDSLAIAARLVDGRSDRTLWSGRFARLVREALHIEVDIARQIAASLRSSFTRKEQNRIEAGQTENPVARDLYLRAGDPLTIFHSDSVSAAREIQLLRRAAALDSTFAAAWFRLGIALQRGSRGEDSIRMAYDRAIRHARLPWLRTEYRALRAQFQGERDSALTLAQEAVRLNPGNPKLVWNLSEAFKWRQDLPDALVWERKARDLDPLNPVRWTVLGDTYVGLYLDRRAERAFRQAIRIDSTYLRAWGGLIDLRILHRDYRAALALADSLRAAIGDTADPAIRGVIYLWMGQTAHGRELLERALKTQPWRDVVYSAPEIVRARLATGDTAGADSLARRAEATLHQIAADFGLSQGMPFAFVELAAVRGRGAEAARRLREQVKNPTREAFRWALDDPDFGAVRSDTAFQHALAEVRARIMRQRREALDMLAREHGG